MDTREFNKFFMKFKNATVEDKIDLYCSTLGLNEDQYMQLLRTFPPSEFKKLERALV